MVSSPVGSGSAESARAAAVPSFDELYDQYFSFVWRMLRRLGVPPSSVPDAAQNVFMVVYRRHADLRGQELARSWLYGIVVRVAAAERRSARKNQSVAGTELEQLADARARNADAEVELGQRLEMLDRLLDTLSDEQREVLVLVELEQLTVPEISELLGVNQNTIYTRLRAARRNFALALSREQAKRRSLP